MEFSGLMYSIGQWCGIFGFLSLSFLIFSGDTARFWDGIFGLDRIIKFQRKFALFTAFFILFHPVFFVLSGQPLLSYIIPNFALLPLALGIVAGYIFLIVMLCSAVYKRVSYTAWQYIHVLTYILFAFAIYHAFFWGSDSAEFGMQLMYGITLLAVTIGAIFRTQYKIRKRFAGKFFIKEVRKETEDSFTLIIKPEKKFVFKAGQFCFLRLNKNSLHARHPFTIANAPDEEDLRFTIKNTGRFTQTASELKAGEEILIDGPFGKFTEVAGKNDLVFLAGGVGITPFLSMVKNRLLKKDGQNIILLYCSRSKENIIAKNEFDAIDESWFKKVYILSDEKGDLDEGMEKGYLTEALIKKYVPNIESSVFYICGPMPMKNAAKKILAGLQVSSKNIIIEDFFW